MKKLIIILLAAFTITSCAKVDPGHRGVEISWGGKTNMTTVYTEGIHYGLHWMWDDITDYDAREQTIVEIYEFNDKNNMLTTVEISLDYKLEGQNVNKLHKLVKDWETKLHKTLKSAAKEVIPQYSAIELNITKRGEAERKLAEILSRELPEVYIDFARVQMTDVDLPIAVSQLAEETAKQIGRNELASKKKSEQTYLAEAKVAEAQGNYDAGILNAKTKDIMSQPKMLELYRLENERVMWEGFKSTGVSPFGNNNMYGVTPTIVKGLGK
jgi:hypothetical protein